MDGRMTAVPIPTRDRKSLSEHNRKETQQKQAQAFLDIKTLPAWASGLPLHRLQLNVVLVFSGLRALMRDEETVFKPNQISKTQEIPGPVSEPELRSSSKNRNKEKVPHRLAQEAAL